jgi:hypothetical protein
MDEIDWNAPATIYERGEAAPDRIVNRGSLAQMVSEVAAMGADERARLTLDYNGDRMLGVEEILALSQRGDFP